MLLLSFMGRHCTGISERNQAKSVPVSNQAPGKRTQSYGLTNAIKRCLRYKASQVEVFVIAEILLLHMAHRHRFSAAPSPAVAR